MKPVDTGSFLTLHYRLAGPDGADMINTFGAQPATLSLGAGQLAPAMEALLLGLTTGRTRRSSSTRAGVRRAQPRAAAARGALAAATRWASADDAFEVGDVVQFPRPDGEPGFAGVVREAADDWLLFDFNHPLAGQRVTFEVELIGVL